MFASRMPGKLVIAGERMHAALLRRFYVAHGYQLAWETRPVEARRLRAAPAHTLVLADGFSCREQIEQCTGRRTLHVAEAVAG